MERGDRITTARIKNIEPGSAIAESDALPGFNCDGNSLPIPVEEVTLQDWSRMIDWSKPPTFPTTPLPEQLRRRLDQEILRAALTPSVFMRYVPAPRRRGWQQRLARSWARSWCTIKDRLHYLVHGPREE